MSWPALIAHARGVARAGGTTSSSTSSRTSAATSSRGSPARRAASATGPAGGGALLTDALDVRRRRRTCRTTRALVARAAGRDAAPRTPARGSRRARAAGRRRRRAPRRCSARRARPLVGVHVSGGRESKQWHLDRFAGVARELAARARRDDRADRQRPRDRPLVDAVAARSRRRARHRRGRRAGPADAGRAPRAARSCSSRATPARCTWRRRWARRSSRSSARRTRSATARAPTLERIVRVDLPCSPCGQVRLPPERCRGHVPDCMDGITVDASSLPRPRAARRRAPGGRPRAILTCTATLTCVTPQGRELRAELASTGSRPSCARPARVEANAWIKRLRLVPYDGADDARALHVSRRLALVVHRAVSPQDAAARHGRGGRCWRSRPLRDARRAGAAARRHRRSRRPRRGARVRRARASIPVEVDGTGRRAAAAALAPAILIGLTARLSRLRPARAIVPRQAARRRVRAHGVLARRRPDDDGPEQESYIGPVLDAIAAAARRRATCAASASVRAGISARGAGGIRSRRSAARVRSSRRSSGSRRARRSPDALALWRQRQRARAAPSPRATASARPASFRGCDLWPVLRRELEARRAAAVAVVGARDGRGRRRRSTRSRRTRSSPTRKPAAGDARSCSKRGAAACRRSACSTASSIATG